MSYARPVREWKLRCDCELLLFDASIMTLQLYSQYLYFTQSDFMLFRQHYTGQRWRVFTEHTGVQKCVLVWVPAEVSGLASTEEQDKDDGSRDD